MVVLSDIIVPVGSLKIILPVELLLIAISLSTLLVVPSAKICSVIVIAPR